MKNHNSQIGIGLVEVLVAVLLLSIAILGFSALQIRAVKATDESLVRTKSLTIVRNLAEVMRAYPEAYVKGSGTTFIKAAPLETNAVPVIEAVIQAVVNSTNPSVNVDGMTISVESDKCFSNKTVEKDGKKVAAQVCSMTQLAARDALMVKKIAADEDIRVNVVMCPGTSTQAIQRQMCVITAWNDTKASLDDSDGDACASTNGVYKIGSHCLISEAY